MAYTPTNWSTGDTITASDMNKLENAVANAGKSGNVFFTLTTTNFPSSVNDVLGVWYLKKTGTTYSTANSLVSGAIEFVKAWSNYTVVWYITAPIPSISDYYLAVCPATSGIEVTASSGGIASDPVYPSNMPGLPFFIVTGDFSITVNRIS